MQLTRFVIMLFDERMDRCYLIIFQIMKAYDDFLNEGFEEGGEECYKVSRGYVKKHITNIMKFEGTEKEVVPKKVNRCNVRT